MEVLVTGTAELKRLALRLEDAGRRDLQLQLVRAAKSSVRPLKKSVVDQVPAYLPNRYARVMGRSLRFRTASRRDGVQVTITARGKTRDRAVPAIDGGLLRHPVYGNRFNWVGQSVRGGFVSGPMRRGRSIVEKRIKQAMESVAATITGR